MDISLNSSGSGSFNEMSSTDHNTVIIHSQTHAVPHAAQVAHIAPVCINSRYINLFDFLFKKIGCDLKNQKANIRKQNYYDDIVVLHAMTLANRHYFAHGCAIFHIVKNNMMGIVHHPMLALTPGNALLVPKSVRLIPGDVQKIHKDLNKLKMSLDDAIAILSKTEQECINLVADALEKNCTHLLKCLLAFGLNPNICWEYSKDGREESILECAVQKNDVDLVQALIQAGAFVEGHRPSDGKTLFMVAADFGNIEIMQALKNAGADINACDRQGRTALVNNVIANTSLGKSIWDVDYDAPRRVGILLQLGVDTEIMDDMRWTAFLYADLCKDESIYEMLIESRAKK